MRGLSCFKLCGVSTRLAHLVSPFDFALLSQAMKENCLRFTGKKRLSETVRADLNLRFLVAQHLLQPACISQAFIGGSLPV